MSDHDNNAAPAAATPAASSPQQRRLAGLRRAGGSGPFRTVCRVAVPDGVAESSLRAVADAVVTELLAAVGEPDEPVGLTLADGVLTLDLPAACADETTALAVVRAILDGDTDSGADGVPHSAAAQWWDELTKAPSAGSAREFWRMRAAGWSDAFPAVLGGPASADADTMAVVSATIDRECLAALDDPSGAPAWLLAAWQVLLRRHAGLDDVVIGVGTDLRRHEELHGCRGPLTAHLPARAPEPLDAPLAEHARAAARQLSEGTDHAEWFDWERALPDRSAGTRPLSFGFSYTVLPEPWTTPAGSVRVLELAGRGDAFALWLRCQEGPAGLELRLEYLPRLVPATLAADLVAELPTLLAAGRAAPDRPAAALTLTTPEIHERLLRWGSGPTAALPDGGLPALVRATASDCPHATAVRDESRTMTYRQLVVRMDGLAAALRDHGVRQEDRVAVSLPPGPDLLVALLGVLAAGGAYLYLDPAWPPARSAVLAADAAAQLVVTADGAGSPVRDLPALPVSATAPADPPLAPVPLDALAYVLHTPGTPQGVMVTHRGLVNHLTGVADGWPADGDSLVSTSASVNLTLPALYLPLLSGSTVTFGPPDAADPAVFADELAKHPYALVRATPAQLRTLHAELTARQTTGNPTPPLARCIAIDGAPLPASLADGWPRSAPDTRLLNHYGPIETAGARTHGPVSTDVAGPTGTVPLGAPIANTTLQVVDAESGLCPLGVTGELHIGGAGLARGYLDRPAATADRFVPDPHGSPGARRYRTGDLVRWLPGRRLEFVTRVEDQVPIRRSRVEPAEVAAALSSHPGIRQVVVFGHDGPEATTGVVAYAVATAGPVPVDALRRHAGARLPDHIPVSVVWLDALPLDANGRLDRSALPVPAGQLPDETVEYQPPRTETERVLAEVWAEVLGLERVGVLDNYFVLGGDSILSIMVTAKAAKRGLRVSLRHFIDYQTIIEMAPYVERTEPAVVARSADRGLTPIQHWFFEQDLPRRGHWNQGWLFAVDDPDVTALAAAVAAVVAQHPALGSRFEPDSAAPLPGTAAALQHRTIDEENWATDLAAAVSDLQEVDISTGPLLRVALLDGGPGRQRLAMIGHHLVVDTVSWQIIFDDLTTAYRQARAGTPISLPATTMPPDEWAGALTGSLDRAARDLDYWLDQCPADQPPLPVDRQAGPPLEQDQRQVDVVLDQARTECLLRQLPADIRVDQVLTAAVALAVADWTGRPCLQLAVEGQGRAQDLVPGAELYRSVGWYTSMAPLLIRLPGGDPLETLRAVRDQFHAMPQDGLSYGVLRYLAPEHGARLAERPEPQLSVNYIGATGGAADRTMEPGGLALRPAPEPMPALLHPANTRSWLWTLNAVVLAGRLHANVGYAGEHYLPATAQRLADGIIDHLVTLIDAWTAAGGLPVAPRDFPLLGADRTALDTAVAKALAQAPRRPAR